MSFCAISRVGLVQFLDQFIDVPVIVLVSGVEEVPQLQFFDSGYIFFISLWMALEEFPIFLRGLVDSDPEVVVSLSHVAALVVNNGSACIMLVLLIIILLE